MCISKRAIEHMVGSKVFIFREIVAEIDSDFLNITSLKPTSIMRRLLLSELTLQLVNFLLHLLNE